jgi:hypothetical protein
MQHPACKGIFDYWLNCTGPDVAHDFATVPGAPQMRLRSVDFPPRKRGRDVSRVEKALMPGCPARGLEDIEHGTNRVKRPRSNGIVERFHHTLLDGHSAYKHCRSAIQRGKSNED